MTSILVRAIAGGVAAIAVAPMQSCSAQGEPPHLIEIVPASGQAGAAYPIRATIRGKDFMPEGNAIEFGPVKIADLSSADHVRLTFAVPKWVPSGGEVPPMMLIPGKYPVTVITSAGRSNSLLFTLTRGPVP